MATTKNTTATASAAAHLERMFGLAIAEMAATERPLRRS